MLKCWIFVEMSECLLNHMTAASSFPGEKQTIKKSKQKLASPNRNVHKCQTADLQKAFLLLSEFRLEAWLSLEIEGICLCSFPSHLSLSLFLKGFYYFSPWYIYIEHTIIDSLPPCGLWKTPFPVRFVHQVDWIAWCCLCRRSSLADVVSLLQREVAVTWNVILLMDGSLLLSGFSYCGMYPSHCGRSGHFYWCLWRERMKFLEFGTLQEQKKKKKIKPKQKRATTKHQNKWTKTPWSEMRVSCSSDVQHSESKIEPFLLVPIWYLSMPRKPECLTWRILAEMSHVRQVHNHFSKLPRRGWIAAGRQTSSLQWLSRASATERQSALGKESSSNGFPSPALRGHGYAIGLHSQRKPRS